MGPNNELTGIDVTGLLHQLDRIIKENVLCHKRADAIIKKSTGYWRNMPADPTASVTMLAGP